MVSEPTRESLRLVGDGRPDRGRGLTELVSDILEAGSPAEFNIIVISIGKASDRLTRLAEILQAAAEQRIDASTDECTQPPNPRRTENADARRDEWMTCTDPSSWEILTDREKTVAMMAARAMTNQQIARRLRISPHTVNYHLRRVYQKLDIRCRVELALHQLDQGVA